VVRNPIHATGVGLLLFGQQNSAIYVPHENPGRLRATWEPMKSWFQGNF